jgi:hypothetical protein
VDENDRAIRACGALMSARSAQMDYAYRRRMANMLREQIGDEAYLQGRLSLVPRQHYFWSSPAIRRHLPGAALQVPDLR